MKHKAVAAVKDPTVFGSAGGDGFGDTCLIEAFNVLKVLDKAWGSEFGLGTKADPAGGRQYETGGKLNFGSVAAHAERA